MFGFSLRSRKVVRPLFAVAALLIASLLSACSPPPPPGGTGTSSGGTTVTVWLQQKPDKMSPLLGATSGNGQVINGTHLTLGLANADGIQPGAAASWELSPVARTITLKLGDHKWSDGEAFTAEDTVFSLNLYAHPDTKTPVAATLSKIEGASALGASTKEMSGVKALDDKTVEIKLTQPDSGVMYQILRTVYQLPQHKLAQEEWATLADSPIWAKPGGVPGLGPLVMAENQVGQRVRFTKNVHSPTQVKFDTLVANLVNQDVATSQLSSNEIDFVLLAPTDVESVKQLPGITTATAPSTGFDRYAVNFDKPYLKNPKVRQAMLTAIDRAGIISSVYAGQAEPVNSSFTSPTIDPSGFETYAYDPNRAKQLLQEAGWDANQQVTISQASGNAQREAVNQVVVKNLNDIGMKVSINPVDQAQITDLLTRGDFDLLYYGGGNYAFDPSANVAMMSCATVFPKGDNINRFCDRKIDEQLNTALKTGEPEERKAAFQQAAELENQAVPLLWVARPVRTYGWGPKITGGVVAAEAMPDVMNTVTGWQVA